MYIDLPTEIVRATNGVEYAYRQAGESGVPLVLLQHFRGNLDNWDPALLDKLATSYRVVAFDNVGVGNSTGSTPHTIDQMAYDAIAFLEAMEFGAVDLLGFSIGSFVAQEIALIRPAQVRRLVLVSSIHSGCFRNLIASVEPCDRLTESRSCGNSLAARTRPSPQLRCRQAVGRLGGNHRGDSLPIRNTDPSALYWRIGSSECQIRKADRYSLGKSKKIAGSTINRTRTG